MNPDGSDSRSRSTLSSGFDTRLYARLGQVEGRRRRVSLLRRMRWPALITIPILSAACWAALPWTFGIGARALIGLVGYYTLMLSIASRVDDSYLSYLHLSFLPILIDVSLLVGVVSWLVMSSRSVEQETERRDSDRTVS